MGLQVNWIAVAIAAIAGTATAGIWYQEAVFGKAWRRLTGVTPKQSKKAGSSPMIVLLLSNLITAIALAASISIVANAFGSKSVLFALTTGFVICSAFSLTTLVVHNGFELKRKRLTLINGAYQFVLFLGMTLIISLFGV